MSEFERDPFEIVAERLDAIQETLEQYRELLEEIVEKLDNLGLPGSGFHEVQYDRL
jgi:hypothetical protein